LGHELFDTVTELAEITVTPAESYAIEREGHDVVSLGNDRLHAHAHESCDWRWNALHARPAVNLPANKKGSVLVDKKTATITCGDEFVSGSPLEYREKEQRLRPVGTIVRQRLRYSTEAALGGEQAQCPLYE
tara:strand:+ start:472 stop:867 length:396 start_codon:yes stop_codon:yes gene_type:complete